MQMETLSSQIHGGCYRIHMATNRGAFGEWLRQELDKRGLSQADFARRVGTSPGLVSNWINNRRVPDPASAERIADGLSMNPDVVLAAAGHRPLRDAPRRYELERRIRELEAMVRSGVRIIEEEIEAEGGVAVRFYGRVPADTVRWVAAEQGGGTVPVLVDYIGTRSPNDFLVVEASGDCLRSCGILSGDYVLLERTGSREPRDGQIVLVRFGDEYSLKEWHRDGSFVELRDGDGHTVRRFSMLDEFTVVGVFVARWSKPPAS